jgi:cysteine desulfurase
VFGRTTVSVRRDESKRACERVEFRTYSKRNATIGSSRGDNLERDLSALGDFVHINAADAPRHPGNLNVRFDGYVAKDILAAVQPHLAASTGSACTSGIPEPSHVLRAIGLSEPQAEASIRFSLGRFTTQEDIEIAVMLLRNALSRVAAAAE